nr:MAG TPA: hypothetical protein [Caudoviricetes sp.]
MFWLKKICKFIQFYNDKSFYLLYNYLQQTILLIFAIW